MKRNVVLVSEVPEPPYLCALVSIPTAAVPFTLSALVLKSAPYWYASRDDWHRGRKLLADFGKDILMPCDTAIVNGIDRLYNLIDAGLNGTDRSATGTGTELDPYVYDPPIPQVMLPSDFQAPGLRRDMEMSRLLLANLVNGTLSTDAPDEAVPNARLEAIRAAVQAILDQEDINPEDIAQIISLLGAL